MMLVCYDKAMSAPLPIVVENFRMRFGDNTVVDDLSFEVRAGETFGFLGSNGSGKTTTIRALLSIYEPTSGRLLVHGQRFGAQTGAKLGYLPEERGLYKKESVLDTMVYFGRLKDMRAGEARTWSLEYLERVGLADKAGERIDKLSGGQQQKVQLGVTIMNRPSLLILDEPTKGFDPVNRRLLMDIVEELAREGTTTVLVTHQMEEVERLCDRVMLLKDGVRRLYGSVDEVRSEFGSDQIAVRFGGKLGRSRLFRVAHKEDGEALLTPAAGVEVAEIFSELGQVSGLQIRRFEVQRPSLDDIFVQIYREDEVKHA